MSRNRLFKKAALQTVTTQFGSKKPGSFDISDVRERLMSYGFSAAEVNWAADQFMGSKSPVPVATGATASSAPTVTVGSN